MTISFVVAAATNNAMGIKGDLPWSLPNDMKHFKNVTWGMPVIMGRKTFDSLGKPLAGRKNIVITRQPGWKHEDTVVVNSFEDALFLVREADVKEAMVIGGGEIFKAYFDRASRIYLTRVDASPEGDTFFPELDAKHWKLISQQDHEADERHAYNYSFQTWERI